MDLIADTNVWYDLAAGSRDPAVLKGGGRRLLASPINLIEISSKISPRTFPERRDAARAVLDHADAILRDPERHLADIWGLNVDTLAFEWRDGFQAIAEANDPGELNRGVVDFQKRQVMRVNTALAESWRTSEYEAFARSIEVVIDGFCPGYSAARRLGKIRFLRPDTAALFHEATSKPELVRYLVRVTRDRAALHLVGDDPGEPTDAQVEQANAALTPYVRAYLTYLRKAATTYAPRPNDWGDLECFTYLQGENRLLTRDARWIEIANESDLGAWLLDPEAP